MGAQQGGQTGCLLIAWPGWRTTATHAWGGDEAPDIDVWYGGLVDGMRDASGQMYMRNRYYDPVTGQFTQTDPIGLAGGLNAYGFAAGDPVSYSDPYGLCAWGLGIDAALGRCSKTDLKHAPQDFEPYHNSISSTCASFPQCRRTLAWASERQREIAFETLAGLRADGFCGELRASAAAMINRGFAVFDFMRIPWEGGTAPLYGEAAFAFEPYPRPGPLMFLPRNGLRNGHALLHEGGHGLQRRQGLYYRHGDMTSMGLTMKEAAEVCSGN